MPNRYRHISSAEFAHGLEVAGLTLEEFCRLYGAQQRRAQRWLDGKQDIPHSAAMLLGLFEDPAVAAKAKAITDILILETEPGDAPAEEPAD